MGVQIDVAGRHDQAGRVEDLVGLGVIEAPDGRDATVLYADIGTGPLGAGAVHHHSTGDDRVIGDHECFPLRSLTEKPTPLP